MADYRKEKITQLPLVDTTVTFYSSPTAKGLRQQYPNAKFEDFFVMEHPEVSIEEYFTVLTQSIVDREIEDRGDAARFKTTQEFDAFRDSQMAAGDWKPSGLSEGDIRRYDEQLGRYHVGEYNGIPVYVDPTTKDKGLYGSVSSAYDGRIYIRPPYGLSDGRMVFTYDVESTLAHEFGHIKTWERYGPFVGVLQDMATETWRALQGGDRSNYNNSPIEGIGRIYGFIAAMRWPESRQNQGPTLSPPRAKPVVNMKEEE